VIPQKGIHVQTAMGWLTGRLLRDEVRPVPFEYDGNAHHFGGGSENMKLLYAVCGYVGGAEQGRQRLLNWYESEKGHGGGEPLTVSHGQLHLGGHAAAILHAQRTGDSTIMAFATSWLQVEYALLSACLVGGEPWTAGARGVQKGQIVGENKARGAFVTAVKTGRAPGLNRRGELDQYFLGAMAVAALPAPVRARLAQPPDKWPAIQGGLKIERYPGGHFWICFESLPIGGGGVRAAGFDGEKWIERGGAPERIAAYGGNPAQRISLSATSAPKKER
jgi:hypothetical protein